MEADHTYLTTETAVALHQWHSGMDAIYAAGSLAYAKHPVPCDVAAAAADLLDSFAPDLARVLRLSGRYSWRSCDCRDGCDRCHGDGGAWELVGTVA